MLQIDCPAFENYIQENPDLDVNELLRAIVSISKEFAKNKEPQSKQVLSDFIHHQHLVENNRLMQMQDMFNKSSVELIQALKKQNQADFAETMKSTFDEVAQVLLNGDAISAPLKENKQVVDIVNNRLESFIQDSKAATDITKEHLAEISKNISNYIVPWKETNNGVAGTAMEKKWEQLLVENLEEGYDVENVSKGEGHKGDLRVTYTGRDGGVEARCPILVEVKFWKTKPVDTLNVGKFHNDIIATKTHGIMVATEGLVTKKHNMQFEVLPGTNLIAMYLTKVGENVERVIQAMEVIYVLDNILQSYKGDVISPLTPRITRTLVSILEQDAKTIRDIAEHSTVAKRHIDETLKKLKKLRLEKIKHTLMASLDPKDADKLSDTCSDDEDAPVEVEKMKMCKYCKKSYALSGLSIHKQERCKKIPEADRSKSIDEVFVDIPVPKPSRRLDL